MIWNIWQLMTYTKDMNIQGGVHTDDNDYIIDILYMS